MNPLRRQILAALALSPCLPSARAAGRALTADVLVLGAGMAGLSCATELRRVGYTVIVLEARDRIGGRTWTDSTLGVPLDLGGAWIHGVDGNPLTRLVADAGITTFTTDWESQQLFVGAGALKNSEMDDANDLAEQLTEAMQALKRRAGTDADLKTAYESAADELLDDGIESKAASWQLWSDIGSEYGDDFEHLSLSAWDEDEEFPGDHVLLKSGYGALCKQLARGLDIRLNTRVQAVEHGDDGIRVRTSDGVYESDAAICTLPLGVLKGTSVKFDPQLPTRHRGAIQRLAMGALDKVAMRFPRVFWPAVHRFARVDGRADRRCEFYNLMLMHQQPILVALTAGDRSRSLEALSEDAVVEQMMAELRAMFGPAVPAPIQVMRTRWASDPFAGGSYSLMPPGASIDDFGALSKRVGSRLFMAGEATVTDYPGTVHGAWLSGLRAAGQVAEELG